MSEWTLNDGIEDGDDNEMSTFPYLTGREGTIYLIDVTIFENIDHFRSCLDCIEADLLKNILINPRDLMSVIFYNTQYSHPPSAKLTEGDDTTSNIASSNCAVFIPLKPLSKDLIQYFKNFSKSDDFFDFNGTYGLSNGSSFSEALWLCSRLIIRCNYRLIRSKIILFTNNEIPHSAGTQEQHQAFLRAKDLKDNQIDVELVPLVDEFDLQPFYKEFLSIVQDLDDQDQLRCDSPPDQRYKLINRHHRGDNRKACLRHINFELADNVSLSCDVYSFIRKAKKPNPIKMTRENKDLVSSKRSHFVGELNPANPTEFTQRKVLTSQLYKAQKICSKEILFSKEEIIAMKTIQSPGLRLLGFKPLNQLETPMMVRHCLFLYPNEKFLQGSTTLFRGLWEKCFQKQKYALCILTMRRLTTPKYVALIPQTMEIHGNDGFGIIYLPVDSNIGALESIVKLLPEPSPEQVSLFEQIRKKLRFKYSPQLFSNPALQSFYAKLEALVYDEEVRDVEDLTLPDLLRQDDKTALFLEQINQEFGLEDNASGSRKRALDDESGAIRSKTLKTDLSLADVEEAIRNGQMAAVTVPQIKDFIRNRNANAPNGVKKVLFEFAQKLID